MDTVCSSAVPFVFHKVATPSFLCRSLQNDLSIFRVVQSSRSQSLQATLLATDLHMSMLSSGKGGDQCPPLYFTDERQKRSHARQSRVNFRSVNNILDLPSYYADFYRHRNVQSVSIHSQSCTFKLHADTTSTATKALLLCHVRGVVCSDCHVTGFSRA